MLVFSGICGTTIGFFYGKINRSMSGALMKSLTGLILHDLSLTALLVPITGFLYVFGVFRFVDHMQCKLPLPLVGSIVAGTLSVVITSSVWAIQATLTHQAGVEHLISDSVFEQAFAAISGGVLGGMLAGGMLAATGLRWLDME